MSAYQGELAKVCNGYVTYMHKEPGLMVDGHVGKLKMGDVFLVIDEKTFHRDMENDGIDEPDEWCKVVTSTGFVGWVQGDDITGV